jgi:hypothetical protein
MTIIYGARAYRARLFDGTYEALADRMIVVTFDASQIGSSAWAERERLNALLANMVRLDDGRCSEDTARLVLHDAETGEYAFEWLAQS